MADDLTIPPDRDWWCQGCGTLKSTCKCFTSRMAVSVSNVTVRINYENELKHLVNELDILEYAETSDLPSAIRVLVNKYRGMGV